jgi:hypothetical protein
MSWKVMAAAIALAVASFLGAPAEAAPVAPAASRSAAPSQLVETVQHYHRGRRYCWHADGWKGAGWYWCGQHRRRGYGWGGPAGWNSWVYRPVAPAPGYFYKSRRYCWHADGWKGAGWYWCGQHRRRGYGWGGPAGWNKWKH